MIPVLAAAAVLAFRGRVLETIASGREEALAGIVVAVTAAGTLAVIAARIVKAGGI